MRVALASTVFPCRLAWHMELVMSLSSTNRKFLYRDCSNDVKLSTFDRQRSGQRSMREFTNTYHSRVRPEQTPFRAVFIRETCDGSGQTCLDSCLAPCYLQLAL